MKLSIADITAKNLADLRFAIGLLRDDFDQAIEYLGIDSSSAETLLGMTQDQLKQLSRADVMLFGFRLTSGQVASATAAINEF